MEDHSCHAGQAPTSSPWHQFSTASSGGWTSGMLLTALEGTRCWKRRGRTSQSFSTMSSPVTPRRLPFSFLGQPCNLLRGFRPSGTPTFFPDHAPSHYPPEIGIQGFLSRWWHNRRSQGGGVTGPAVHWMPGCPLRSLWTTRRQSSFARTRLVAGCCEQFQTCVRWSLRMPPSLGPPLDSWIPSIQQFWAGCRP